MAYVKWKDPRRKPPRGAIIDRSDPITRGLVGCWLFNELSGISPIDISGNFNFIGSNDTSNLSWKDTIELNPDGGDAYFKYLSLVNSSEIKTCVFKGDIYGVDSYNVVFAYYYYDGTIRKGVAFAYNAYSATRELAVWKNDFWVKSSLLYQNKSNFAFVIKDNECVFFADDEKDTVADTTAVLDAKNDEIRIGELRYNNLDDYGYRGKIYHLYLFSRPLTDSEIRRLSDEPYSFFLVPVPRTYIVVPSTGKTVILKRRKWLDYRRKPPRGARIDWTNPITKGLVGCWLMNEYGGGKVVDLANGNDGVLYNGATWKDGGIDFDGSDDYILINKSNIAKTHTVLTKIKKKSNTDVDMFFCRGNDANTNSFRILSLSDGKVQYYAGRYDTGFLIETPFALDFSSHTFAQSFDGKKLIAFYDGEKQGEDTSGVFSGEEDIFLLGKQNVSDEHTYYSNMLMYFVYLFSRALTDEEIKFLSENPYSFFELPAQYIVQTSSGDTIATVDTASLTISAVDVSVEANTNVTVDTAQLTVTAPDATAVVGGTNVSVDTAYLTITAPDATAHGSAKVVVDTASLTITAYDVVVTTGTHVEVDTAYLTIQAYDVYVTTGTTFDPTFTVLDKDGNGIEGAWVRIYSANNSLVAQGTTNSFGTVSFTGIADGTYRVIISHSQYQKYTITMYMQDGDDYKYRLYKRQPLGITPFGTFVKLKPEDPLGNIYG